MNIFDRMSEGVHSVLSNIMGYSASWTPFAQPSEVETATVLMRQPTRQEEMSQIAFAITNVMMEYHEGIFTGLKAAVDSGSSERVTLNGTEYVVLSVNKKYDGRTYVAKLELPYGE